MHKDGSQRGRERERGMEAGREWECKAHTSLGQQKNPRVQRHQRGTWALQGPHCPHARFWPLSSSDPINLFISFKLSGGSHKKAGLTDAHVSSTLPKVYIQGQHSLTCHWRFQLGILPGEAKWALLNPPGPYKEGAPRNSPIQRRSSMSPRLLDPQRAYNGSFKENKTKQNMGKPQRLQECMLSGGKKIYFDIYEALVAHFSFFFF